MANVMNVRLSKGDSPNLGFRLQGGKDFGTPLVIQKVNVGSPAEKAGLSAGDSVIKINNTEVYNLRHKDAQDVIVRAGPSFDITVQRGGSTWKPHVQNVGSVPSYPTSINSVSPVTRTSLAAHNQSNIGAIGTGHNVAAKPFNSPVVNGTPNGTGPKLVNKQFNSPIGLYSEESIAETLSAQAEVLSTGALGVNFKKNEKNYDASKSAVYHMLQEAEKEPRSPEPEDQSSGVITAPLNMTGLRHVSAPETKPVSPKPQLPPGQNICGDCERLIVGVFVRIKDKNLHVECFKCSTCGTSLKNVGYYNINNKLYCDIHAKLAARNNPPAPNLVPVTVSPGGRIPAGTISAALSSHPLPAGPLSPSSNSYAAPFLPPPPPPNDLLRLSYVVDDVNSTCKLKENNVTKLIDSMTIFEKDHNGRNDKNVENNKNKQNSENGKNEINDILSSDINRFYIPNNEPYMTNDNLNIAYENVNGNNQNLDGYSQNINVSNQNVNDNNHKTNGNYQDNCENNPTNNDNKSNDRVSITNGNVTNDNLQGQPTTKSIINRANGNFIRNNGTFNSVPVSFNKFLEKPGSNTSFNRPFSSVQGPHSPSLNTYQPPKPAPLSPVSAPAQAPEKGRKVQNIVWPPPPECESDLPTASPLYFAPPSQVPPPQPRKKPQIEPQEPQEEIWTEEDRYWSEHKEISELETFIDSLPDHHSLIKQGKPLSKETSRKSLGSEEALGKEQVRRKSLVKEETLRKEEILRKEQLLRKDTTLKKEETRRKSLGKEDSFVGKEETKRTSLEHQEKSCAKEVISTQQNLNTNPDSDEETQAEHERLCDLVEDYGAKMSLCSSEVCNITEHRKSVTECTETISGVLETQMLVASLVKDRPKSPPPRDLDITPKPMENQTQRVCPISNQPCPGADVCQACPSADLKKSINFQRSEPGLAAKLQEGKIEAKVENSVPKQWEPPLLKALTVAPSIPYTMSTQAESETTYLESHSSDGTHQPGYTFDQIPTKKGTTRLASALAVAPLKPFNPPFNPFESIPLPDETEPYFPPEHPLLIEPKPPKPEVVETPFVQALKIAPERPWTPTTPPKKKKEKEDPYLKDLPKPQEPLTMRAALTTAPEDEVHLPEHVIVDEEPKGEKKEEPHVKLPQRSLIKPGPPNPRPFKPVLPETFVPVCDEGKLKEHFPPISDELQSTQEYKADYTQVKSELEAQIMEQRSQTYSASTHETFPSPYMHSWEEEYSTRQHELALRTHEVSSKQLQICSKTNEALKEETLKQESSTQQSATQQSSIQLGSKQEICSKCSSCQKAETEVRNQNASAQASSETQASKKNVIQKQAEDIIVKKPMNLTSALHRPQGLPSYQTYLKMDEGPLPVPLELADVPGKHKPQGNPGNPAYPGNTINLEHAGNPIQQSTGNPSCFVSTNPKKPGSLANVGNPRQSGNPGNTRTSGNPGNPGNPTAAFNTGNPGNPTTAFNTGNPNQSNPTNPQRLGTAARAGSLVTAGSLPDNLPPTIVAPKPHQPAAGRPVTTIQPGQTNPNIPQMTFQPVPDERPQSQTFSPRPRPLTPSQINSPAPALPYYQAKLVPQEFAAPQVQLLDPRSPAVSRSPSPCFERPGSPFRPSPVPRAKSPAPGPPPNPLKSPHMLSVIKEPKEIKEAKKTLSTFVPHHREVLEGMKTYYSPQETQGFDEGSYQSQDYESKDYQIQGYHGVSQATSQRGSISQSGPQGYSQSGVERGSLSATTAHRSSITQGTQQYVQPDSKSGTPRGSVTQSGTPRGSLSQGVVQGHSQSESQRSSIAQEYSQSWSQRGSLAQSGSTGLVQSGEGSQRGSLTQATQRGSVTQRGSIGTAQQHIQRGSLTQGAFLGSTTAMAPQQCTAAMSEVWRKDMQYQTQDQLAQQTDSYKSYQQQGQNCMMTTSIAESNKLNQLQQRNKEQSETTERSADNSVQIQRKKTVTEEYEHTQKAKTIEIQKSVTGTTLTLEGSETRGATSKGSGTTSYPFQRVNAPVIEPQGLMGLHLTDPHPISSHFIAGTQQGVAQGSQQDNQGSQFVPTPAPQVPLRKSSMSHVAKPVMVAPQSVLPKVSSSIPQATPSSSQGLNRPDVPPSNIGSSGGRQAGGISVAPKRGRGVLNVGGLVGSRIPLCGSCHAQIRGPFITALGKIWCPEHFICATPSCRRPLQDLGFVEERGQLYCEYCFEQYLAPSCAKCNSKIKGDCLKAIGKNFHPECFNCTYCGKLFGNSPFFLEDGAPYCEADWNELFTTKCFACGFPVEAGDRWVEALNNNYHSQCFNCTMCKKNLEGQSFFAKGGRPFCKNHAR